MVETLLCLFPVHPSSKDFGLPDNIDAIATLQAITDYGDIETVTSSDLIRASDQKDQNYTTLLNTDSPIDGP